MRSRHPFSDVEEQPEPAHVSFPHEPSKPVDPAPAGETFRGIHHQHKGENRKQRLRAVATWQPPKPHIWVPIAQDALPNICMGDELTSSSGERGRVSKIDPERLSVRLERIDVAPIPSRRALLEQRQRAAFGKLDVKTRRLQRKALKK